MNNIHEKQSSDCNVKIAAAFRFAYNRAKLFKSCIWSITLLLVFFELLIIINNQNIKNCLSDNLAVIVLTISPLLILIIALAKHCSVNYYINLGCTLHRLYDFEVLGLGTKPTFLEIRPSQIQKFSKSWLDKKPTDHANLIEWYPKSVSNFPENVGVSLCLLHTCTWENELRNKYKFVLFFICFITIILSLLLMHLLDYKISDYFFNIFVPLSPFFAILIDELLVTRSCLQEVRNVSLEAQRLFNKYDSASGNQFYDKNELNTLNYLWCNYRSTASPIFDWLYWVTQKNMNMDMADDANELGKGRRK